MHGSEGVESGSTGLPYPYPRSRAKLREMLSVKNERLGDALEALQQAERISRTPTGFGVSESTHFEPFLPEQRKKRQPVLPAARKERTRRTPEAKTTD